MANHLHRLLVIIPAARRDALNAWVASAVDAPPAGPWFTAGLSATGEPPATHYWACFAATNQVLRQWLQRVCVQASLAFPEDWDGRTRAAKKQWLADNAAQILANIGVRVRGWDNDAAAWDDPQEALAAAGLKVVGGGG